MFSDPQFWVAVSFFLFIIAIFNPVRKVLISSLDTQINEIKNQIKEAEDIKNEAQKILSDLKIRQGSVEKEIQELKSNSDSKIAELKKLSSQKLRDLITKRKIVNESKIDQLIRDTNLSIKNHITNIAIEASTNIFKNNLTDQKKSNLINDSIQELNSILKNK